ncbi:MAG: FAD-dependent oxidoreductase [Alphaproteobacteria bacterium]
MTDPFIIIGASHAGVSLAGTLRKKGWTDGIVMLEKQSGTPIQRPPLSKSALKDDWPEDRNYIQSADWYGKHDIDLRTGVTVTGIDPLNRTVTTDNGESLLFSRLALATGASPRRLNCPGHDLPGIHYIRTLADAYSLRDDLKSAENVVVVGGGYIGLEAAACMCDMGKSVTVIEMEDRLLARVATPETSAFFERLHESHGVKLVKGLGTSALEGQGRVEQVVLTNGDRIAADVVVVGIGVIPDLDLLEDLGETNVNGVAVSRDCQTKHPEIYAIGDIAKLDWPFASMRVESIHNAQYTASLAAHHALNIERPAYETPWFWSDQHGGKLQSVGVPLAWDEVIWRDGEEPESGAAFSFREGQLVSVEAFNLVPAFMLGKKLFAGLSDVTKAEIEDKSTDLRALMKRKPA